MSKKAVRFAQCALLFALSFPAEAQQTKKVPRIGYLATSVPKVFYRPAMSLRS